MRTKRRLCIVAALLVLASVVGCVGIDYADSLGQEDSQWNIPSGYTPYLATVRTPDGLKDIVVLRDRHGEFWYRDSEGQLQPVKGGVK